MKIRITALHYNKIARFTRLSFVCLDDGSPGTLQMPNETRLSRPVKQGDELTLSWDNPGRNFFRLSNGSEVAKYGRIENQKRDDYYRRLTNVKADELYVQQQTGINEG